MLLRMPASPASQGLPQLLGVREMGAEARAEALELLSQAWQAEAAGRAL